MSKIFGGSKSKSKSTSTQSSSNRAFEPVSTAFTPLLGQAQSGIDEYNAFMGGDTTGFDKFKAATNYDFNESEGMRKIIGSRAGRGVFQSGASGRALQEFGTNLQGNWAQQYLDRLLGRTSVGFQAGNSITGAGNISSGQSESTSKSKSKPGIGQFIGQVAAGAAASDRRLKMDITKVGEFANGLNVYQYHYVNGAGPYVGVMADEVEKIQPEALGPVIGGYMTVDYGKINKEFA